MVNHKPNILIVCSRNKKRSRTAESIFKNDNRFNIKSVGLSVKSKVRISDKDILWSDIILVMEYAMANWIRGMYRHLDIPKIEVLSIEDEYEYMDGELIEILNDRINDTLRIVFKIEN